MPRGEWGAGQKVPERSLSVTRNEAGQWKQGWSAAVEHLPGMHKATGSKPSTERGECLLSLLSVSCLPRTASPCHMLPLPGARAKQPRTEPSKTRSQNKPFLGKWSLIGGQEQAKTEGITLHQRGRLS